MFGRSALLIYVTLLGLCTWPAYAFSQNFTQLNSLNDAQYWSAVGRLVVNGGDTYCTATLISEDVVLTAAHCIYDNKLKRLFEVDDFEFQSGFQNGRASAYRKIRQIVIHNKYNFAAVSSLEKVRYDIALLRLKMPIRNTTIKPFIIDYLPNEGMHVGVVSYAKGRLNAPAIENKCFVHEAINSVAIFSCEADFGASGSPVFDISRGTPFIVAIVSSIATLQGQKVSLGPSIQKEVPILLQKLNPSQDDPNNSRRREIGAKFIRP